MAQVTERRCDRCGRNVGHGGQARLGVVLEVHYHHPQKLDLCAECEGAFTLWLGKHPLWGVPLERVLNGLATGDGYPTKEQIERYKAEQAAIALALEPQFQSRT